MAEPEFPLNRNGEVDYMLVKFADVASGGRALTLTLRTERGQTTTTVLSAVTDVTAQTTAETATSKRFHHETNVDSDSVDLPRFSTLGIGISYATGSGATSAPIISEVKIFYKNIPLPS